MDRREFQRIHVSLDGIFHLQNQNLSVGEFSGTIEDISEGGIRVAVKRKDISRTLPNISEGEGIHFDAIDEYMLNGKEKFEIISGRATVMRQENYEEALVLGCRFDQMTFDLEDYVRNRKLSVCSAT